MKFFTCGLLCSYYARSYVIAVKAQVITKYQLHISAEIFFAGLDFSIVDAVKQKFDITTLFRPYFEVRKNIVRIAPTNE